MLAVIMSVTSTFLKKEGEQEIDAFIVKLVSSIVPPATVGGTNMPPESAATEPDTNAPARTLTNEIASATTNESTAGIATTNLASAANQTNQSGQTNQTNGGSLANNAEAVRVRKLAARQIHDFIQNTRSGALGIT